MYYKKSCEKIMLKEIGSKIISSYRALKSIYAVSSNLLFRARVFVITPFTKPKCKGNAKTPIWNIGHKFSLNFARSCNF